MELNIPKMTKSGFLKVLEHYGCKSMTAEKLDEQIASGAPVNEDGTINIVNYTAWILKELRDRKSTRLNSSHVT